MDPVTLMSAAVGLRTKASPARLQSDDEGVTELATAVNVDVTDSHAVRRRKGYKRRASTGGHSLYADSGECFFVSGNSLCRLASDFSHTQLVELTVPDYRMTFCRAPDPGGDIYFSNGLDRGIFDMKDQAVVPWTAEVSEDKGEKLSEIERLKERYFAGEIKFGDYSAEVETILRETEDIYHGPPPNISHMEWFEGSLYVATDKFLLFSSPYDYSSFDLARGFIPFTSRILFVRRVPDGLYVGTMDGVFFLAGTDPREMQQRLVFSDRPIEYTDARVRAADVMDQGSGEAVMWATNKGIAIGAPGGQVLDPVRPRIDFPSGLDGAAISYEGSYLALFKM